MLITCAAGVQTIRQNSFIHVVVLSLLNDTKLVTYDTP